MPPLKFCICAAFILVPASVLTQDTNTTTTQSELAGKADSIRSGYKDSIDHQLEIVVPSALMSLTFRGHAIGAERWTENCGPLPGRTTVERGQGVAMCRDPNSRIGDIYINGIYYTFSNDRLHSVDLDFASTDYEQLLRAFTAKFGRPDSTWVSEWQNRMGARFENHSAAWQRGPSILVLKHYGRSLDSGTGSLTSRDALRAEQQAADSAAEQVKQDL